MRAALLPVLLAAGCMTGAIPDGTIDAKRACSDFEGMTFEAAGSFTIAIAPDDADYSTYRWVHADGTTTTGLVQCEVRGPTTLLYADAAERATGRIDDATTSLLWFGTPLALAP